MFDKFKIFRDNWKEIRDEVLDNKINSFRKHPQCDCTWGEVNGIPTNLGKPLCVANEISERNIKLYSKTWELYKQLDLPSKQTIGFSLLQPTGKIFPHNDPEDCYRYHLCLQAEDDTNNIDGTYMRNTKSNSFINEGEDVILLPQKITHSAKNESKKIVRIHLLIDYLKHKSQKEYKKEFGGISEWNDKNELMQNPDEWVESSNYYHDEGCSARNPCSNNRCNNFKKK